MFDLRGPKTQCLKTVSEDSGLGNRLETETQSSPSLHTRGGGLGSRPKKMYGERLGDGVEYHFMSPTPHR